MNKLELKAGVAVELVRAPDAGVRLTQEVCVARHRSASGGAASCSERVK